MGSNNNVIPKLSLIHTYDCAGFDGIMLDMEAIPDGATPPMRPAITAAVCTLKAALSKALPGGVLYWTADTVNTNKQTMLTSILYSYSML